MTQNGKKVLEIINNSSEHLTAEQIYQRLQAMSSRMALATVYNNLNSLYEEGLIRKVSLQGEPDRYDRLLRHDHLICRKCGKIADIYLDDISDRIEKTAGFKIDSYDLKIFYLCDECREKL